MHPENEFQSGFESEHKQLPNVLLSSPPPPFFYHWELSAHVVYQAGRRFILHGLAVVLHACLMLLAFYIRNLHRPPSSL